MSLYTVTIGADTFEVYVGLPAMTKYANGSFGPLAKKWRNLSTDEKSRTLIEVTRYIDTIVPWRGIATGLDNTTLAFPRSGDGITMSAADQLALVEKVVCQLVLYVATDPAILTTLDQSSNIRKLDADGTSIEYFAPTSVAEGTATRYPLVLKPLLDAFFAVAAAAMVVAGGVSFGTCGEGNFDDWDGTDRSGPF